MTNKLANKKPPLGLVPQKIFYRNIDIERFYEVGNAMIRYINANLQVPKEWSEEYFNLFKKISNDK